MRILAIETSERLGSLSTLEADCSRFEADLPADQRTASAIGPSIVSLLAEVGWRPADVQLVAVTNGPGSFTGLRIGTTFAKTFAYAVGANVHGCDTLETIAMAVPPSEQTLWVVTDAQRQQVFARSFTATAEGVWSAQQATAIMDIEQWLTCLDSDSLVAGSALKRLQGRLPAGTRLAEESAWRPHARHLAQLAWRDYQQGRRDDLWKLTPDYYRLSYAEEKEAREQPT